MNELYRELTGEPVDFAAVARAKKALILREILGSDINRLTGLFLQICEENREYRDYTRHEIHEAIRDFVTFFPVYRTYIRAEAGVITESDVQYISQAIDAAKAARPDLDDRLFEFLRDVLQLRVRGDLEQEFVMRFQQVTTAAMAKGVEDTAFYCYLRLISLNEVGGDPEHFGVSPDSFHKWCSETQAHQPCTLLDTSTHDTKRSEDVRTRISLLSEIPAIWAEAVRRWSAANSRYRTGDLPDRKTEYLLYQTLLGAWPISRERVIQYMRKAVREAKEQTSWITPNAAFEEALEKFVDALLGDTGFVADLEAFLSPLAWPALVTSLSLILLKLTAPGIPNIYQGTELWDWSLVDPDNRRPVDFELRRKLLSELEHLSPERIIERRDEGLPKLWTIRQALRARNAHPEIFGAEGSYQPLWATGAKAAHVVAFLRTNAAISIAPRLLMKLDGWDATLFEVPEGRWRNQFTGDIIESGKLEVATLLNRFPVGLLIRETAA